MLRSRVLSGIDTARLAEAVSRPGIDPRIWISYAVLASEPYVETEAGREDVVADVILLPSGTLETARVGAIYAGNGFGLYTPLHIDDEVLVLAPSGDPDEGMVITQRLWSPADKPPSELNGNIEDLTLVIEEGKNLRITTKGSGNIYLTVDAGKVYLGSADGAEPATKGQSLKSYLDDIVLKLNTHVHNTIAPFGSPTTPCTAASPPTTFIGPTNAILADKAEVA